MSQSEREPYLDEKEKGKSESMSRESEFHAEGRWIPGKAERAFLKKVKTLQKDQEILGFTLSLAKPEMRKKD